MARRRRARVESNVAIRIGFLPQSGNRPFCQPLVPESSISATLVTRQDDGEAVLEIRELREAKQFHLSLRPPRSFRS